MNVLDRAIAAVAPQWGVKRAGARRRLQILNSGYGNYGGSTTKKSLRSWLFGGGSHKEDIEDNLSVLRQRSRDLYMGVPLATGALKACRTNVVGSGLKLKSQIDFEFLGMSEDEARDAAHKRNEALDVRNYATAALEISNVTLKKPNSTGAAAPKRRTGRRRRSSGGVI